MTDAKRLLEKWICPLCSRSHGTRVKFCDRCRCDKCGRPMPREPHSCEREK